MIISYARYNALLAQKGINSSMVANATGIHKSALSDWKIGRGKPKTDKICALADYLDVSVDYFIENEMVETYDSLKDHIFVSACNAIQNRDKLDNVPHEPHEDLALVYDYCLNIGNHEYSYVRITNHHVRSWGIDRQSLHDGAWKSMKKMQPVCLERVGKFLREISPVITLPKKVREKVFDDDFPAYVLSSQTYYHGSSYMFDHESMNRAAGILGGNLIILPYSINMVFVMKDNLEVDRQFAKDTYARINRPARISVDYLSDNIYRYDAERGILTIL